MLTKGEIVGAFEVERHLGEGGMADVYLVRHLALGSPHALKMLSVSGGKVRERLLEEGRTQATLRHPNVVQVTDVLHHNGQIALVMDFIDGPTLGEWMHDYEHTLEDELSVFRSVLRGVRAAHRAGLVHRDLKPANVLMATEDGKWRPMVLDFGLTKKLDGSGNASTRGGVAMGTPEYMAPEQVQDASAVDQRADIFSLGVVLYEMVTGHMPYQGNNLLAVFNAIMAGKYDDPTVHKPDLPPGLVAVIHRMMAGNPDDRFATCDDAIHALDNLDADARSRLFAVPKRLLWTVAGVPAALAIALSFAVAFNAGPDADPTPGLPPPVPTTAETAVMAHEPALSDRPPEPIEEPPPEPAPEPPTVAEATVVQAPKPKAPPPRKPRPRKSEPPVPEVVEPPPLIDAGVVQLEGDADRAWAVASDGTRHDLPGAIPAGAYEVVAVFGGVATSAADLVVRTDEERTLKCMGAFLQCR